MATSTIRNNGLRVIKVSKSVSIAPNTNTDVNISFTVPTGYRAVGVIGIDLGTQTCTAFNWNMPAENAAFIAVRSNRNDTVTINVGAFVLLEPN